MYSIKMKVVMPNRIIPHNFHLANLTSLDVGKCNSENMNVNNNS